MRTRLSLKTSALAVVLGTLLCACTPNTVYHSFHSVSATGWKGGDTLRFSFSLPDTTTVYALSVESRYHLSFPYTHLPIRITLSDASDVILLHDTLCLPIADEQGRRTGTGWGDLRSTSSPALLMSTGLKDTLQLILLPVLADSLLPGINDIGVCIERL